MASPLKAPKIKFKLPGRLPAKLGVLDSLEKLFQNDPSILKQKQAQILEKYPTLKKLYPKSNPIWRKIIYRAIEEYLISLDEDSRF